MYIMSTASKSEFRMYVHFIIMGCAIYDTALLVVHILYSSLSVHPQCVSVLLYRLLHTEGCNATV